MISGASANRRITGSTSGWESDSKLTRQSYDLRWTDSSRPIDGSVTLHNAGVFEFRPPGKLGLAEATRRRSDLPEMIAFALGSVAAS